MLFAFYKKKTIVCCYVLKYTIGNLGFVFWWFFLRSWYEFFYVQLNVTSSRLVTDGVFRDEAFRQQLTETVNSFLSLRVIPLFNKNDVVSTRREPLTVWNLFSFCISINYCSDFLFLIYLQGFKEKDKSSFNLMCCTPI